MAKIHKELLAIMNDYNLFMDSDKQMELPIAVTHEKSNHASSLYLEDPRCQSAIQPSGLLCRCKDTKKLGEFCNLRNNSLKKAHFCSLCCSNQLI
jgi:hypothetical protein